MYQCKTSGNLLQTLEELRAKKSKIDATITAIEALMQSDGADVKQSNEYADLTLAKASLRHLHFKGHLITFKELESGLLAGGANFKGRGSSNLKAALTQKCDVFTWDGEYVGLREWETEQKEK